MQQHDFSSIAVHPASMVSTPDDSLEQQAERRAAEVVRKPCGCTSCGCRDVPSLLAHFESRLGGDFHDVRIHTDARAAASARALRARAYTTGTDIVFGGGEFAPERIEGQRLLAHELVHVEQQRQASSRRIFRQALPQSADTASSTDSDVDAQLATLLEEIVRVTEENVDLRVQLDALPPASSLERQTLTAAVDRGRESLMPLLEERIALLATAIDDLSLEISGVGLDSYEQRLSSHPLYYKLERYERERVQHENQLTQLTRWQTRRRIGAINEEIARVESDMIRASVSFDLLEMSLLHLRHTELVLERNTLAKSLTSSAHEYKQFDPRWGSIQYGQQAGCTNIKAAGCGPSSLAMVLNFLYSEDPDAIAGPTMEFVTPDETAAYAATHGRVCNSGTYGPTMVTDIPTQWPGFRGKAITLDHAADELNSGNLVIFLCKGCTGKNRSNKDRTYGGHFMVLNGVDATGETFNVLDSGSGETKDIETITRANLASHNNGFWIVERK